MHAVDPDQDVRDYGEYRTLNFVVPSGDFVFSAGVQNPGQPTTVAYGRCDSVKQNLGHTRWSRDPFAYFDRGPYFRDDTMHFRHVEDVIYAGETIRFSFVFIAAEFPYLAYSAYLDYVDTQCDCGELRDDSKKDIEYIEVITKKVEDLMEKTDPAEAAKLASPNNFLLYELKDVTTK